MIEIGPRNGTQVAKFWKSNPSQMALKGSEVIEIDDSYQSPEDDDCFILESDPFKKSPPSKNIGNAGVDLQVVAEKGQVACRDYPHSRHTCAKYTFEKTSHDLHCELCYCYVCDLPAPCPKWTGLSGHCHAFNNEAWNADRKVLRKKPS